MSYTRIIPRDLFNEANLLKCYGKLFINLENTNSNYYLDHDLEQFDIHQFIDDGSLWIKNVTLKHKFTQKPVKLFRPLNSRLEWPLVAVSNDNEEIYVFNEDGNFSEDMIKLLKD
mgnify:FL=1